jgi:hypothetical protein
MSALMRKDTSIWALIARLATIFGGEAFQLVDHWDADLFAIGLASVRDAARLVYVSTFRKPAGTVAYECEGAEAALAGPDRRSEHAEFPELVRVLADHLEIAPQAGSTSD